MCGNSSQVSFIIKIQLSVVLFHKTYEIIIIFGNNIMKTEVCLMCVVCFVLGWFVHNIVGKCGREHLGRDIPCIKNSYQAKCQPSKPWSDPNRGPQTFIR